jgi:phosphoenolpyruvate carboxykinase (GTP)
MCGKTSTAMMQGEWIVGDDIAYLRRAGGEIRAVNVEKGIFGIIDGINSEDDPLQWEALRNPAEVIFSNVLVTEGGGVYWNGMDGEEARDGINYSGKWSSGKEDGQGKQILPSHRNARFTFDMKILGNLDPKLDDPEGVKVSGIIYGGRDSDTCVPVEEAFDWVHGIITKGACLESETTAATLGQEGVRVFNPMSNLDFLSIPIGRYIQDNLDMGKAMDQPPAIFSVNYFLLGREGQWLNHKNDKKVWLKWMELRVQGDVEAIVTPTGRMPLYDDLKRLFKENLDKDYTKEEYEEQFALRVRENLAKIERMKKVFTERVLDTPDIVFKVLEEQKSRLEAIQAKHGDYVEPQTLRLLQRQG